MATRVVIQLFRPNLSKLKQKILRNLGENSGLESSISRMDIKVVSKPAGASKWRLTAAHGGDLFTLLPEQNATTLTQNQKKPHKTKDAPYT